MSSPSSPRDALQITTPASKTPRTSNPSAKGPTLTRRTSNRRTMGRRTSKRLSTIAQKKRNSSTRPATASSTGTQSPIPVAPVKPQKGGFFRRLAQHFKPSTQKSRRSSKILASNAPRRKSVETRRPTAPVIPVIVQPVGPKPSAPRDRSRSPGPSFDGPPRPASPGRVSLSSFRYPPLPPSPSILSPEEVPISKKEPTETLDLPFDFGSISFAADTSDEADDSNLKSPSIPTSPNQSTASRGRGRQPSRGADGTSGSLLSVPGVDDVPPLTADDDEAAWTDEDREQSAEQATSLPELIENTTGSEPAGRRNLTVVVPPHGTDPGLTLSPTSFSPNATTLEKVDEDEESPEEQDRPPSGIDFVIPAAGNSGQPPQIADARARTTSSENDAPKSNMKRTTTFGRLFGLGNKNSMSTSPSVPEPRRSNTERNLRGLSIHRPSKLETQAKKLPTRSPTVRQLTNTDISTMMDDLRHHRSSYLPSPSTPNFKGHAADETERLTEAAFF